MAEPTIDRLRRLDACAVSDALDTLRLPGATIGIRALWPVTTVVAGRVRTVTAGPKQASGPAAHIAASVVDDSATDDVIVIANGGRMDVSCWGGILTTAAVRHGVAGVVIDGVCRDIGESAGHGLPVFGRGVVPVSARGRIVQQAAGEPVEFAGVTVHESDLVIADVNGVVFVPIAHAGAVIDLAERIVERETRMVTAVVAGRAVGAVMHDEQFPTATPVQEQG